MVDGAATLTKIILSLNIEILQGLIWKERTKILPRDKYKTAISRTRVVEEDGITRKRSVQGRADSRRPTDQPAPQISFENRGLN